MYLEELSNYKKKSKNFNTIQRHLLEISQATDDYAMAKLIDSHQMENHALFYYQNIHKKAKETPSLHGYLPLTNTDLTYKGKSLYGTIFTLSQEQDYEQLLNTKIEINDSLPVSAFKDTLRNAPLPFVFMSKCELYDFRDFMNELYSNKKTKEMCVFGGSGEKCTLLLMEPFILTKFDLEYLINDLVGDENIYCLLYGFLNTAMVQI